MVFSSCKPIILVVVYSFVSLVRALIEQEIVNSLKIKYSVVEKKEYTFFPQQGSDLTIPCDVVDGYQQLSDWFKNGIKIHFSMQTKVHYAFSNPRMILAENRSLVIRNVVVQDKGLYVCKKRQISDDSSIITKAFVTFLPTTSKSVVLAETSSEENGALSSRLESIGQSNNYSICNEIKFGTEVRKRNECDESKKANKYEKEVFVVLLLLFIIMVVLVVILLFPQKCKRRKTKTKSSTDFVETSWKNGDVI